MSFLGKFFSGRADPSKETPPAGTGEEGPPQPKKQVQGDTGGQPPASLPKKKFEKPSLRPQDGLEGTQEQLGYPEQSHEEHQSQIKLFKLLLPY